jgi:DNA gyrase subunit B
MTLSATPASTQPVDAKAASAKPTGAYGADQIKILEGLEAVRKRPGMYIGDTGISGLHQLIWEAVDNSIDECMAGRATIVVVRILADGSISVMDDGSGIPVDPKTHPNPAYNGKPAIELVMTVLHAGGKFGEEGSAYKVSGGLHGVGISCVNALSHWLEAEVLRDGKIYRIRFERGVTSKQLHVIGEIPADARRKTGTTVTFMPDPEIFQETEFSYDTVHHRLKELAYLNPGVAIRLIDERVGADGQLRDETFRFERGVREYVEHLSASRHGLHEVIHVTGESGPLFCEIALQFNDSYNELLLSFANNIRTVDGGTHLSGFKTALTRVLNNYAKAAGIVKEKDPTPSGDDWREGLIAVVSAKLPEPQFEGQTKGKLRNTEVEGFVSSIMGDKLAEWLDSHPSEAKRICQKGVLAAQAREAARKARDLTRRKSALDSGSMPHKLRDCTTRDVDRSEMFIVEGDSAGGSATQGRDVETQAILPLRGKLLNVERARLDKILGFEEIRTLISALRCGIGEEFDAAKLRYGRVIIMTDADVDGSHIRTLLLTFFFRQMPELIRRGRIFIAQPPLYLISRGKQDRYVLNEREMGDVLVSLGLEGAALLVREAVERGPARIVRTIEGDDLARVVRQLRRVRELVDIAERRGIPFLELLATRSLDPSGAGRLPTHRITWSKKDGGHSEAFAFSEDQVEQILKREQIRRADFGQASDTGHGNEGTLGVATIRELHENRELAVLFVSLAELGIDIEDWGLTQEEAVTGERLATRYAWRTPQKGRAKAKVDPSTNASDDEGDADTDIGADATDTAPDAPASASPGAVGKADHSLVEAAGVRDILPKLLDVGRRGMEVKRFKGLGEMDAAQLWETTMDPTKRTLLRVQWDDASVADELFSILMGEDVDQRRTYIEQHALEVKSLDV